MPPRRRVSFLLSGVVSSTLLRGDSETECLSEEVVLDNDDSFFLVKRLVIFFHMVSALSLTNIYPGFSTTLSGFRMEFVGRNKTQNGRLSLWWFWTKSSGTQTKNWVSDLPEEDGHRGP
jgi:hypothetical protein